ncbi:MAG: DegV family protein, partial [Anaerolineae bacterium]
TDSNPNLPPELLGELDIHVAPMVLEWDGVVYADGVDIQSDEFFSRLRESATLPTTSGPTPGTFKSIFEPLATAGRPIVGIFAGSGLSSTMMTAAEAKQMLPDAEINLIDSKSSSMGIGFPALVAARAAAEDKPLAHVVAVARQAVELTGAFFTVEDLVYLQKGGRIGAAERFVGSVLDLKPIMEVRDGAIVPIERVRTERRALNRLLALVEERAGNQRPLRIAVGHADTEERAGALADAAQQRFEPDELIMRPFNPTVGTHTGPDALAIAYCAGL